MNLEIDLCSKLDFLHRCLEHIIWILAEARCFFVSKAFNHVLWKLWTPMPAWISMTALIQGGTVSCFTTGNKWTERYGWTPLTAALFLSLTSMLSNRAYGHSMTASRLDFNSFTCMHTLWIWWWWFVQPASSTILHVKNIFLKWKRFSIGS